MRKFGRFMFALGLMTLIVGVEAHHQLVLSLGAGALGFGAVFGWDDE